METWKDIKGYEGRYQVSDKGRIKSKQREVRNTKYSNRIVSKRILKQQIGKDGYCRVYLCKDCKYKTFTIHRLVGIEFIQKTENKPEINHKNGIKTDNRVENLEWCTSKENKRHAWGNGLSKITENHFSKNSKNPFKGKGRDNVNAKRILQKDMNGNLIKIWGCLREAEEFGFKHSNISLCCNNKKKHYKGFLWCFFKTIHQTTSR